MPDRQAPVARRRQYQYGLAISDLSISRGDRIVLSNVCIDIEPGSPVILRGANGAGKTTLLRAIAGFIPVQKNTIALRIKDTPIADDEYRNQILFCGHANGVHGALSAYENLKFWARLYDAPTDSIGASVDALGLSGMMGRQAGVLSAGQQRRLGLCRALISRKPIWLLDEPTSSMDKESEQLFCAMVDDHCRLGGIVLIASHDALPIEGARNLALQQAPAS